MQSFNIGGVVALLGSVLVVSACGDGQPADAGAVEDRIARERADAAADAKQAAEVGELREQVQELKRKQTKPATGKTTTVVVAAPTANAGTRANDTDDAESRTFHAPSGNVSCTVQRNGATCAVARAGMTFSFADGPASSSAGLALPRGAGAELDWGGSLSVGSVTCIVPRKNEAKGVRCSDSESGHGFEASAVPARQRTY